MSDFWSRTRIIPGEWDSIDKVHSDYEEQAMLIDRQKLPDNGNAEFVAGIGPTLKFANERGDGLAN